MLVAFQGVFVSKQRTVLKWYGSKPFLASRRSPCVCRFSVDRDLLRLALQRTEQFPRKMVASLKSKRSMLCFELGAFFRTLVERKYLSQTHI